MANSKKENSFESSSLFLSEEMDMDLAKAYSEVFSAVIAQWIAKHPFECLLALTTSLAGTVEFMNTYCEVGCLEDEAERERGGYLEQFVLHVLYSMSRKGTRNLHFSDFITRD